MFWVHNMITSMFCFWASSLAHVHPPSQREMAMIESDVTQRVLFVRDRWVCVEIVTGTKVWALTTGLMP